MSASFCLCVYCGARSGADPAFAQAARELGRSIGERGWQLVYGGGQAGLMGEVADAALAAGAKVTGIIPKRLMEWEVGHKSLHELRVVETMHERKQQLAEMADAFVALPGGLGTLEELFEAWTWRHLGYHQRPIGLLNSRGYYQPLLQMLNQMRDSGFVVQEQIAALRVEENVNLLLNHLASDSQELAHTASGSQHLDLL